MGTDKADYDEYEVVIVLMMILDNDDDDDYEWLARKGEGGH